MILNCISDVEYEKERGVLMKKCIVVIVALFYSIIGVNMVFAAADTWTQKADFGGTERGYATGFSIGSKGYIGTGQKGGPATKDFWEYDPATDTWTQKADFGGGVRFGAVGFSIGNRGYMGTGSDGTSHKKDFWEYDPVANTWIQKADCGGTERYFAIGFSIGNKGYIGTGLDVPNRKDFWEYDPVGDTWTQKSDFGGIGRYGAVGFSIGSKGYTGTGSDGSSYYKDFWEYDPATDTWTQKADFGGTAPIYAVGFAIGSKGYIGTGYAGSSRTKSFWEYDPFTDAWTQKADFGGTERNVAIGFAIGSKGYIGTGASFSAPYTFLYYKDFWGYEPTTTSVALTFEGLTDWEIVGDYYIGGYGYDYNTQLPKSGPGPNDGVIFKNAIQAGINTNSPATGMWRGEPTPDTAIWFQQGEAWVNVPNGFTGSLSFYYGNPNNPSKIYIYDGLNKTGNLLATLDLPTTIIDTDGAFLMVYASVSFTGTARSVDFSEEANSCFMDDITLGALNPPLADTIPDKFTFTDQTDVALGIVVTSNTITVSGIDAASPITITGGTYAINGGSYTSASGTVNKDDTVTVQQTSSESYSTTTIVTLTIGGVSGTFSVTTQAADTTPDTFYFADRTNVALNTTITSNTITVSGIDAAASISIVGGKYSINGGAYTSVSGTVVNGNTVKVKLTSARTYSTTTNATLTIGGVSDTFSVTTRSRHYPH